MKEDFVLIKGVVVNVKNINYIKFSSDTYNNDDDFFGGEFDDELDEDEITLNHMEIGFAGGNDVAVILDKDPQKAKEEFNQYVEVIMNKLGENTLILD